MKKIRACIALAALILSPLFASQTFIVSGASNFILDQIRVTTSDFVQANGLNEGDTVLITPEHKNKLLLASNENQLTLLTQSSGGAVSNTLGGLALLGIQSRAFGAAVDDVFGRAYLSDLNRKGVQYRLAEVTDPSVGSGACYIFVTEAQYINSTGEMAKKIERTMATSLGVSGQLSVSQEDRDWVAQSDLFIAEGYLFHPSSYNTMMQLAQAAKSHGKQVSLSIAAGMCASNYKESINQFIQEYADLIIGDAFEACTLTDTETVSEAIAVWQAMGKKGAVTCGAEGAYVFDSKSIYAISAPAVTEIVDATGAGDLFVAGFIAEWLSSGDIQRAGQLGSYCAGCVLKVAGGYPETSLAQGWHDGAAWSIPSYKIK